VYLQSQMDFAAVYAGPPQSNGHASKEVVMPELGLGTNSCECTDCGEFFNSVYGFDKHRVFAVPDVEDWDTRTCLTPAQLRARGWLKNARGFWITEAYDASARKKGGTEC
jgi:hypothetical protein